MTATDTTSGDGGALRIDAERNRARILEAARAVYAERGLEVPLTEVARRAGVGIATLYRRFPTSDDLIAAAFAATMEAYADTAEACLEEPDPWIGFRAYVRSACEMQSQDAGFADILALAPREAFAVPRARAFRAVARLIRRAQDAGGLRPDFVHQDLVMLLMANAGLIRATDGRPEAWRRFTEYMLQSFRAPAAGALPPAPTPREMYDAMDSPTTGA